MSLICLSCSRLPTFAHVYASTHLHPHLVLLSPLTLPRAIAQADWNVDEVSRFIEATCRTKFGNEKCDAYKRLVVDNDVDGEVSCLRSSRALLTPAGLGDMRRGRRRSRRNFIKKIGVH